MRVWTLKITKTGLILCCKIFASQSSLMLMAPSEPQKEAAEELMAPSEPQEEVEEELRESTEQEILALPIPKCKSQQNTDGWDKIKDLDGRNIRKAFNKVRMEVWINETMHLEF